METIIILAIICYIILFVGTAVLLTYLDAKYWEVFEFPFAVIILSLIWPLTLAVLGIGYVIYIPYNALVKFLKRIWNTVHENKENKE